MSNSRGVPYFFNTDNKESSWEPPAGLSSDQISQLPGAQYLKGSEAANSKAGQVRASHLLVKHAGSRRPSSWKEVRDITYPTNVDLIVLLVWYSR